MGKGRTKVLHEPDCAVIRDVAESADESDDLPHIVPKCTCQKDKRKRRKRSMKRSEGGCVSANMQDGAESLMDGNYRANARYYE